MGCSCNKKRNGTAKGCRKSVTRRTAREAVSAKRVVLKTARTRRRK